MALQIATMAALARATEAPDESITACPPDYTRPSLGGWRLLAAGGIVLGAAALLAVPAVTALGVSFAPDQTARAAAWLARLPGMAPALVLGARAAVLAAALLVISRTDDRP